MGRLRKEGNEFFSFDVDFFSDRKIKILKARYGADGITLYIYLLCEIYKNGFYLKLDEDFEFIVSDDLNMNSDKVKQVLTFLLERSMFDKQLFQSDAVLTSTGIQRRYQLMVKSRAVKNPITVERYWLLSEEETETFIKVNSFLNNSKNNEDNSKKNNLNSEKNDTKEKKGKEKNIYIDTAETKVVFQDKDLESAFQLFVTCRAQNGQKLTEEQIILLREELQSLGDTVQERIAIAKKATVNGWKSFYPLKKQESKKQKPKSSNKFNNFHQRDYDMAALEKELLNQQK
ncbi:MAG: DUF4373 domain-containing protein [Blautia hansenii]|nr:DUF4373 domain-containing protein [Blautia hansenii]MEE0656440.1 DUF4373 domain-containing protein [Blautia hansenii]